jgi:septum formation protein
LEVSKNADQRSLRLLSDLAIGAADTVVLTHAQPSTSEISYSVLPEVNQELLEKPISKEDNLRMLLDLNGGVCEVVTGVSVGESFFPFC